MTRFSVAIIAFSFLVFGTDANDRLRVICKGDEISKWLSCEDNHVLQIDTAKFGRDNDIMCEPPVKNKTITRICGMKNVYGIISSLCDNKQKCDTLVVNMANLGEMKKCENVRTYLEVYRDCVKIKESENPRGLTVEEASKKKAKTRVTPNEKTRTSIQFAVRHNSSTSNQPMGLFIILLLGTFCSLYY